MHPKYSRQILLSEIGSKGQSTLAVKTVAIVGLGALGTIAAELLARSGLGSLILIDRDTVETSNLQRQVLFQEHHVGKSKAETAEEMLRAINSNVNYHSEAIHLNAQNISLLKRADLVLDCTDNLATRFIINDYCAREKIPWVYAAAVKTTGYVMPILPDGPCLRCFLRETSTETCETVGVLNTITATIASLQVTQALKVLLKYPPTPKLFQVDVWTPTLREITITRKKNCPACNGKYEYLIQKMETKLIRFCSTGQYQVVGKPTSFKELKRRWKRLGEVTESKKAFQFQGITIFKDGRALINAKSEKEAFSLYSKWIGN